MEKTLKELFDECDVASMKMVDIVLIEHSKSEIEEANKNYQLTCDAFEKKLRKIIGKEGKIKIDR